MSTHTLIKRRAIRILVVALALVATPVASAATPSWYPQLHLAVVDAGDAGAAIGTCATPRAQAEGRPFVCDRRPSEESADFNRVSVFAEIAQDTGPCRRLLFKLNHTAVNAAAKPSPLTSPTTLAKEISGRSALAQSATQVTADFAALPHCLGKS